jgi:transcriptional regulator with XRE-family HTH domain
MRRAFGQTLVYLRYQAGLTQEQLAEKVDLSTRHLQAIEAGDYWPTLPTLRKFRRALNVSWETLCDD